MIAYRTKKALAHKKDDSIFKSWALKGLNKYIILTWDKFMGEIYALIDIWFHLMCLITNFWIES